LNESIKNYVVNVFSNLNIRIDEFLKIEKITVKKIEVVISYLKI